MAIAWPLPGPTPVACGHGAVPRGRVPPRRPCRWRLEVPLALAVAGRTVRRATPVQPWLQEALEATQPGKALETFLDAVKKKDLELYPAQKEAIKEVFGDHHVVLNTPTGSGKSLVATALLFRAAVERAKAYYTCPVKALVSRSDQRYIYDIIYDMMYIRYQIFA